MSLSDFEIINPSDDERSVWGVDKNGRVWYDDELSDSDHPEWHQDLEFNLSNHSSDYESNSPFSPNSSDEKINVYNPLCYYKFNNNTNSLPDLCLDNSLYGLKRSNSCPDIIEQNTTDWIEEQEKLLDQWIKEEPLCNWIEHDNWTKYTNDNDNDNDDWEFQLNYQPHEYQDPNKYYQEYDNWKNYLDEQPSQSNNWEWDNWDTDITEQNIEWPEDVWINTQPTTNFWTSDFSNQSFNTYHVNNTRDELLHRSTANIDQFEIGEGDYSNYHNDDSFFSKIKTKIVNIIDSFVETISDVCDIIVESVTNVFNTISSWFI